MDEASKMQQRDPAPAAQAGSEKPVWKVPSPEDSDGECVGTFDEMEFVTMKGSKEVGSHAPTPASFSTREAYIKLAAEGLVDLPPEEEGSQSGFANFAQLLQSAISQTCGAAEPITCGSTVSGSTVGTSEIRDFRTDPRFLFCPETAVEAEISTCGSTFDTWLRVSGTNLAYSCDNCGDCGRHAEASINFMAGECYQVLIDGYSAGDYVLSINCTNLNDSVQVECGSRVSGTTLGLADALGLQSGKARHVFCPKRTVSANISTCGSSFDTSLQVTGAGVQEACDDCGDCGLQAETTITFLPNECYEILIDGSSSGDYVLSVACTDVNTTSVEVDCGSSITGTTVGLPPLRGQTSGVKGHVFCPNRSVLAHVSTCGSSFDTWLYVEGPGVNFSCHDCGDCTGLYRFGKPAEATLNFLSGACYNIQVAGKDGSQGEYALSISCTESAAPNSTCPVSLLERELPDFLRPTAYPLTVWGSKDELQTMLQDGLVTGQVILAAYRLSISDPASLFALLASSVRDTGVHLIVHQHREIIQKLTNWTLEFSRCASVAPLQLSGGGFGQGPVRLKDDSPFVGNCFLRSSLPETVDGLYGSYDALAWTSPFGKGRITYLGVNFERVHWFEDFKQLMESSISEICENATANSANTTNTTAVIVECGGIVRGTVVVGTNVEAQSAKHTFCAPESEAGDIGQVLFSTCGSSFDTALSVESGSDQLRSCADCGRCGKLAEFKFIPSAGACYDVLVYGSRQEVGNYTLWVSCCAPNLCNGNGQAKHIAWGPPGPPSTELCRCNCGRDWTGPTCSECKDRLAVVVNGSCQSCIETRSLLLLALYNTRFTWTPEAILSPIPECAAIQFDYLGGADLGEIEVEDNQFELDIALSSCSQGRRAILPPNLVLTANDRSLGEIICVPQFPCTFSPGLPTVENNSSHIFAVHVLAISGRDETLAVVVLSFLDLLISALPGNGTFVIHDRFQNNFTGSLTLGFLWLPGLTEGWFAWGIQLLRVATFGNSSNVVAEVQSFFNDQLLPAQAQATLNRPSCVSPDEFQMPALDAGTQLLVLVGGFCGRFGRLLDMDEVTATLLPFTRRGRQIVGFGWSWPEFITRLPAPRYVMDAAEPTCSFLDSWLWYRAQLPCVGESGFVFSPPEVPALQRSFLEFPRLCPITSCCLGDHCSPFLATSGPTVGCRLPLVGMGLYNVSVTFVNGTKAFAGEQLRVLAPLDPTSGRRTATSGRPWRQRTFTLERIFGVFRNLTNQVYVEDRIGRQDSGCCDLVAVGFDMRIMGRFAKKCRDVRFVPIPAIDAENPFWQPVRVMAVRCYVNPEQLRAAPGVDGTSCELPDVPALAASEAPEMEGTWSLHQRIDEYVQAAVDLAPPLQLSTTNGRVKCTVLGGLEWGLTYLAPLVHETWSPTRVDTIFQVSRFHDEPFGV
eukprot:Skav211196  [mRNA]  locus=scaffold2111:60481:67547:- [translate_table: standard]